MKLFISIQTKILTRSYIKKLSGDSNSWSGTRFHRSGENMLVFRMTEVGRTYHVEWCRHLPIWWDQQEQGWKIFVLYCRKIWCQRKLSLVEPQGCELSLPIGLKHSENDKYLTPFNFRPPLIFGRGWPKIRGSKKSSFFLGGQKLMGP